MKKLLKYLLLFLFLLPVLVKADMSAPMLIRYNAEVIKESGVDYYDMNFDGSSLNKLGHFNKGEIIEIEMEIVSNNITYLCGAGYCVKLGDVVPLTDSVGITANGVEKLDEKESYLVYQDVEVRKGPSYAYDVVGTLKKGTTGEYKYYASGSGYIYVEINGLKGWVNRLGRSVLVLGEYTIILGKDFETKCGTIPANTKFSNTWDASNYDIFDYKNEITLVNYNGCETFIPTFHSHDIAYIGEGINNYVFAKEVKVYENLTSNKVVGTISANTKLDVIAFDFDTGPNTIYVEYANIKGWLHLNSTEIENLFKDTQEESSEPKDNDKNTNDPIKTKEKNTDPKQQDSDDKKVEEPINSEPESVEELPKKNSKDVVITCTIAALSIAVGGVIAIVLINKKKKIKLQDNKE